MNDESVRTAEYSPPKGEWVQYVKRLLKEAGYWRGDIDDEPGQDLERAIVRFQRVRGLTPNGVVGGETWAALARPSGQELNIDWEREYPEIYRLATSEDLADYLRRVVEIEVTDRDA